MGYEGENPQPVVVDPPVVETQVAPAPWEAPIKDLQLNFTQQLSQMQSQFAETLARFNPVIAPPEPAIDEMGDEELEQIVSSGVGGKKLRKMVHSEMAKLKRAYIDPLEQVGLTSIARLNQDLTTRDLVHYPRFKKEIDGKLSSLAPAQRLSPEVLRLAYNAVVGEHAEELQKEAVEAAIRKQAQPAQDATGSSGRGDGVKGSKIPSVETDFGEDAVRALKSVGRTADQQYQRMGYKDYEDFRTKCAEYLGS